MILPYLILWQYYDIWLQSPKKGCHSDLIWLDATQNCSESKALFCYGQVSQITSRFRSSNPVAFDSNSNSKLVSLLELTTAKYRILTAEFSATDQSHSTKAAACIEYTYYSCNEQPDINCHQLSSCTVLVTPWTSTDSMDVPWCFGVWPQCHCGPAGDTSMNWLGLGQDSGLGQGMVPCAELSKLSKLAEAHYTLTIIWL